MDGPDPGVGDHGAPDQAAVRGLDRLSPDHWPKLAANWLAAGFDSDLLRRLSGLRPGKRGPRSL
jgi:hypothetical protein